MGLEDPHKNYVQNKKIRSVVDFKGKWRRESIYINKKVVALSGKVNGFQFEQFN